MGYGRKTYKLMGKGSSLAVGTNDLHGGEGAVRHVGDEVRDVERGDVACFGV